MKYFVEVEGTMKKLTSLLLAIAMILTLSASATTVTELPRNETLYFAGQQWGNVNSWNPIGTNQNNGLAIAPNVFGARTVMFETLYMYNPLDGSMIGLLADGEAVWSDDQTTCTIVLKDAAKWSDGTDVTAYDVQKTFDVSVQIMNTLGTQYGPYIDNIEVVDEKTFVINLAVNEAGQPLNPLKVKDFLIAAYIAQKAWIETLEERTGGDADAMLTDVSLDVVYSGPYGRLYDDDQKVVYVRNDNYWGQDESMWGSLPVPKYLAHAMYADNPAGEAAFKAGQVDVCQQFLPNVQLLWEEDGLPISTYLEEAPYGICLSIPTAWYNMNNEALASSAALRKAIAMAVDYDAINASAMTYQSPTFTAVPRSILNPTDGEQALYDQEAVADLQWAGKDIEGAKALLDEAGIVDTDGDGWREMNGEKLSFNACCPNGWTDWMAAMEFVAAAGKEIGVEITTLFPEYSIYQTVYSNPDQNEYDIFMFSTDASSPSQPWGRLRQFMGADLVGVANNFTGNWGQYYNERAQEIIEAIPLVTDAEELKALYTEAIEIYLTEVPSFGLMYRPAVFHAVNESVWTNFPEEGDGRNIPPLDCTDGYGIAALYILELVG